MSSRWFYALVAVLALPLTAARADEKRGLDIYFVDTEGGAATLLVTPAGESVLIDCGNPGGRDAERIHAVATRAGLTAIDHLLITHWHLDHYGGVDRLAQLLPIRHFYDRGIPDRLEEDPMNFPALIRKYRAVSGGKSTTLRPGALVPLKQKEGAPPVRLLCLCGGGEVIPDRAGAPANPVAGEHKPQPPDPTDNARSLALTKGLVAW
jgi:glyoxylase-like metal-dependent hydrolase (beta-lactamase superfamily II)